MAEYGEVPAESADTFRAILDDAFRADAGPGPDRDEDEPTRPPPCPGR